MTEHSSVAGRAVTKLKSLLPKGKLSRGVAVLAGGNVVGQLITIAASPIITRLYSPSEMGVLAVYISTTAILTVILSLRYETAVALPESDKEALAIVKLALCVVFVMSWVLGAIFIYFRQEIALYFNMPELANYLFLLPLSGMLIGSFMVFRVWCVRKHDFQLVGKARIKQVLSSLFIQIVGFKFGAAALIGGQLANQGAGNLSLSVKALKHPEMRSVSFADMKKAMRRYKKFPLINTWASLLTVVSLQFPTLFFAAMFGPAAAGVYALANRTLKAPSVAVNSAINSVFLTAAAEASHKDTLRPLIFNSHKYLSLAVIPSLLLVSLLAPQVFGVVFGNEWQVAGEYARWMTLMVYCTIVVTPFMGLFAVLERQEIGLVFQAGLFALRLLAFYIGNQTGDAVFTVALFSVFSVLSYFGVLMWISSTVQDGVKTVLGQTLVAILWALLLSSPVLVVQLLDASQGVQWAAGLLSVLACAAHGVLTLRRRKLVV